MMDHLYRRGVELAMDPNNIGKAGDLPPWAYLVFFAELILFLPLILVSSYTLKQIFPILGIIEDENPPAYEPMPLNQEETFDDESQSAETRPTSGVAKPVTASLRTTGRVLRESGGFKALFRGLPCYLVQGAIALVLVAIFTGALGGVFASLATLLAALTLVQYSTAWVHIVITPSTPRHFWQRLPAFKRTFEATWKPILLQWFVMELGRWLTLGVAAILNVSVPMPGASLSGPDTSRPVTASSSWRYLTVWGVATAAWLFLYVPAQVILVRVQASLLPVDEDAIIPFDRTFQGMVEPAVVGGLGYATISDAWKTLTKSAWRRLVFLYIKISLVSLVFGLFLFAVLLPQFILLSRK